MTRQDIINLISYVRSNSEFIEHNKKLFEIFEGDLLKYILADLKQQLSPEAFSQIQYRICPINVLKRIISKLSKIYARSPQRILINGNSSDEELLNFYVQEMKLDQYMTVANELFNLHKCVTIEPFVENNLPRLRVIPADRNLFFSDDKVNPLRPTAWIKFVGSRNGKNIFYIYTDENFYPVSEDAEILNDILIANENIEAINPFGKIPAVYINRSHYSLLPTIDTDTFKMSKAIPILLSDLNFAVMYQSFSIIFGIDVQVDNLVKSPNAFWSFRSDPTSDKKPEIGILKPDVDIDQVLNLLKTELVMWLNSKNIRAGSVGDLNAENFASGISKIVDESDTFEDRQAQIPFFVNAEAELFNLIINHLHPFWKAAGMIDTKLDWSRGVQVRTIFPEQLPLINRNELVDTVIKELQAGLTTRELAIKRLNPEMTEKEVLDLINKIDQQTTIFIEGDENV